MESSEAQQPFADVDRLVARALFVGQRIDLRAFERGQCMAETPLMVSAGANGCAVLFRYGVVVLIGLTGVEEVGLLQSIKPFVIDSFATQEVEEIELVVEGDRAEGVVKDVLYLHEFSLSRLQLAADVLAKSAVLAFYEKSIASSFDLIEPLAADLQRTGRGGRKARELLRHIGRTLSIQGKMVGRVEVEEKPELVWDQPELEKLYLKLENEYELRERHLALERKLELISRTAETVLGLLQDKRTLHVEWYIVILILFEIMLTLYEMFLAPILGH